MHPQFNMRSMLPGTEGVRWHQDLGFLEPEAAQTKFANFWLALTDITPDFAPLSVISGSHLGGALPHSQIGPPLAPYAQVTVAQGHLPLGERVTVSDLKVGGGILFTHKTVHSSTSPPTLVSSQQQPAVTQFAAAAAALLMRVRLRLLC